MSWTVETRTSCKVCGEVITNKRSRTFCSAKCRCQFYAKRYAKYRAEWQQKRRNDLAVDDGRKVQCLICGRWYIQVGSHVVHVHRVTARQYRELNGLDVKRGVVPEWYRKLKGDQALENGTYNNLVKHGKKHWFKKGQEGIGKYQRSEQTLARLKNLSK